MKSLEELRAIKAKMQNNVQLRGVDDADQCRKSSRRYGNLRYRGGCASRTQ